jgi:hypothetical protein
MKGYKGSDSLDCNRNIRSAWEIDCWDLDCGKSELEALWNFSFIENPKTVV